MLNIYLNFYSVVSNPDVEMEVTHEEEKVKDAPLVSFVLILFVSERRPTPF